VEKEFDLRKKIIWDLILQFKGPPYFFGKFQIFAPKLYAYLLNQEALIYYPNI
jgi:hypothetical protein